MGSGSDVVGKAVIFNTRGPRFESSLWVNFYIECLPIVNCIEKTKTNKKWPGMAHFENKIERNCSLDRIKLLKNKNSKNDTEHFFIRSIPGVVPFESCLRKLSQSYYFRYLYLQTYYKAVTILKYWLCKLKISSFKFELQRPKKKESNWISDDGRRYFA